MGDQVVDHFHPMKGNAFYNQNSRFQTEATQPAMPLLARASNECALAQTVRVAEFGCSQGINSNAPVSVVLQNILKRTTCEVSVAHEDLPSNDFGPLMKLLASPEGYPAKFRSVYPSVIGRSFFEQCHPSESLSVSFSLCAAHFLSTCPATLPLNFHPNASATSQDDRFAFQQQASADLLRFLDVRAAELMSGGQLVVSVVAQSSPSKVYPVLERTVGALRSLIDDQVLTADDAKALTCPVFYRSLEDVQVTFERLPSLSLKEISLVDVTNPLWQDFRSGLLTVGDYAAKARSFWEAIFEPFFVAQLRGVWKGDSLRAEEVAVGLFDRLELAMRDDPVDCNFELVYFRAAKL